MTRKRLFRLSMLPASLAAYAVVIRVTVGALWLTSLPVGSVLLLGVLVPVVIAALVLKKCGWM